MVNNALVEQLLDNDTALAESKLSTDRIDKRNGVRSQFNSDTDLLPGSRHSDEQGSAVTSPGGPHLTDLVDIHNLIQACT